MAAQQFDLRLGDCLEVLKTLADSSVDAVVSDPPYGLSSEPNIADVMRHWIAGDRYEHKGSGFMGKSWDSFVPGPEYWREAYRVLKPGGHMLIFAGTRTADLMSISIRFAGFEIRDTLDVFESGEEPLSRFVENLDEAQRDAFLRVLNQIESPLMRWAYGSGFPKSMDVSKAIDKSTTRDPNSGEFVHRGLTQEMYPVTTEIAALRDLAGVKNAEIDALFGTNGMAGHWTALRTNSQPQVPSLDEWEKIKGLLREGFEEQKLGGVVFDYDQAVSRLDKLDAEVARICGRKGKVGDAWLERPVTGMHDRAAAGQTWRENYVEGVVADGPKERRDQPTTEGARAWQGWGTALKPAQEPIILARKPLAGTVGANVLRHGTGAINIDACRIGPGFGEPPTDKGGPNFKNEIYGRGLGGTAWDASKGRWPANLLLAHGAGCESVGTKRVKSPHGEADKSPSNATGVVNFLGANGYKTGAHHGDADGFETVEAWNCAPGCPVADLDCQSGDSTSPPVGSMGGGSPSHHVLGKFGGARHSNGHGDSGGASRFFYVAKPDNGERDLGLDGMAKKKRADAVCREDAADKDWINNPRAGAGSRKGRANIHPTVKPIDLMRWLCRLVTPKDGVVLDPFMGSGTTGVACSREGFRFIGIEREPAYYEIAKNRLIGDSPLFNRLQTKSVMPPPISAPEPQPVWLSWNAAPKELP